MYCDYNYTKCCIVSIKGVVLGVVIMCACASIYCFLRGCTVGYRLEAHHQHVIYVVRHLHINGKAVQQGNPHAGNIVRIVTFKWCVDWNQSGKSPSRSAKPSQEGDEVFLRMVGGEADQIPWVADVRCDTRWTSHEVSH